MTIQLERVIFCLTINVKKKRILKNLLNLKMYEDENKKGQHKPHKLLFLLSDLLRCWRVPYIWTVAISFSLSVLYIIPIMHAVQQIAHISSITSPILSFFTRQLYTAQQNQTISGLIAGLSTLAFGVLIYIAAQFNKDDFSRSKRNQIIFRVVASVLLASIFPLFFFLAGALVRQASRQPLISVVCGFNLCSLYLLGAYAQKIKSADLSSSHLCAKIRSTGDEWIIIVKLTLSTLCHLSFSQDKIYILILLLIALAIAFAQLYEIIFTAKYYHEEIQKLLTIIKLYEFIIVLESIIVLLIPDPLFIGNLEVIAASLLIFSYLSARAFTNHKTALLLLNSSNDLKTEKNAIIFVREIMRICVKGSQEEMIKHFLVSQHLRQCSNIQCFCHTVRSESPYKLVKQNNFMNSFLFSVVDTVRGRFPRSLPLLALYLHAKMQYRPNFSGIRRLLQQLKDGNVDYQDSYVFYQFQNRIERRLKQLNENKEILPIEQVIKQNELERILKDCLIRIPNLLSKKYKLLTQDTVQIDQIIDLSDKVNSDIRIIEEIWRQYSAKETMSTNLDSLFLIYFQGLIPSPLQVKKLKATLVEKTQKLHTLNNSRKNSITMYSERACVLESIFGESLGVVSNTSKSVETVLRIDRDQLLGKNIHDAMPPFLASSHKEAVQRWFSKESFQIGEGLGPGFFIDQNLTAFRCFTYIKLHSEGSVLKVYKLIIRGNDSDVLLMSHDGRIEGLGNQLLESGLFTKEHLHTDIGLLTDRSALLRPCSPEQDREWIRFSYISEGLRDSGIKEQMEFQCSLIRRQHVIGELRLFALIFSDIRRIDTRTSQHLLEMCKMENSKCFSASRNSEILNNPSADSHFETDGDNCQEGTQSSIQDSVRTTEQDKFIIILKKMTCFPQKITLKWRNLVSAVLLLIIIGGLLCFISQATIFKASFTSFGKILKAGSDASNSNLILEVLYNNAIMLDSYCFKLQQISHCDHLRLSNQAFLTEFYDLFVDDAKSYFSTSSYLTDLRFSEHLDKMTNLTLKNKEVQISTFEFIENFYSWTKIIGEQTQNIDSVAQSLGFLFENFETLKNINHQAMSFFNQTGQRELIIFSRYYIILLVIVITLMTLFIALMKIYLGNRWKKNFQLIEFYKLIGKQTATTLSNHFSSDQCTMKTPLSGENQNIHEGFSDYQWTQAYHNYLIVSIVFISIILVFFMIFPVATLLPPSSTALRVSIALVESQSHLIENYFQLKTFYMGFNFNKTQAQFESDIFSRLNQTELEFARIIRSNLHVFSDLDSTFGPQFNSILTQNICLLSKDILRINDVSLCNSLQKDDILHKGITTALYFLQRTTMQALLELRNTSNPTPDYFTKAIFQNLDGSMVFLLRVFEMVQKRLTQVVIDQIPARSQSLLVNHIATIMIALTIWVGWLLMGYREKEQVSDICGYVLQLPETVLSKKHVIRQQKMILSWDGYD